MNRNEARYATVGTPRKFWQTWRDEEDTDETIAQFVNRPLKAAEKDAMFSGDFLGRASLFRRHGGRG